MAERFDIVIFGASGFTGFEVCKALARRSDLKLVPKSARATRADWRWAVAGRSQEKLETVVSACQELNPDVKPDIIIADSTDHQQLVRMAKQAKLVLNCTGPYRFLGDAVVTACIEAGTHIMGAWVVSYSQFAT